MALQIHIVGSATIQNELLSSFLEKEIGIVCLCHRRSNTLTFTQDSRSNPDLIMWNCWGEDISNLWIRLGVTLHLEPQHAMSALFNVTPDEHFEKEALHRGVRGVFSVKDPPSLIAKGAEAIFGGKLWFPRDILSQCVFEKTRGLDVQRNDNLPLSYRQKEVLVRLALGETNTEIGEKLYISPSTVKTHIYKIYRKIGVSNRFQAASWASKNL